MKKIIILLLLANFVFSSCSTTNRKCDGGKKIKSEMW
jgi:hypothetical protein